MESHYACFRVDIALGVVIIQLDEEVTTFESSDLTGNGHINPSSIARRRNVIYWSES